MTDPTLNRRRVLAGTAAALSAPVAALPALAGAPEPANPDAALLALGRDLDVAWARERETFAAFAGVDTPEADDLTGAASDATSAIVAQIERLSATTLAGLGRDREDLRVLNSPSDGSQRSIPDGIAVLVE